MKTLTCLTMTAALVAAGAGSSAAGVDRTKAAARDGTVEIENPAGSVKVVGWDRDEVAVTGSLCGEAEDLALEGGRAHTRVSVEVRGNPHHCDSHLEVKVPKGSRLRVEGFSASIDVRGTTGPLQVESVSGSVTVDGAQPEREVEVVSGAVSLSGPARRTRASVVSGGLRILGVRGDVEASTVSGALQVEGEAFERVRLETVSGAIGFAGGLSGRATLDAQTVSGRVDLRLPGAVSASFDVKTFSGQVTNELGPAARRSDRYTPEKELVFSTGAGEARVHVQTLSGAVRLRAR